MKRCSWLFAALLVMPSWAQTQAVVPVAVAADGAVPMRAYDAQDYTLAFDVLLGAGDLQRAFQLAQKAVQSVPQDRSWRRKLAQVSAWTQRPEVAAQQWLALFSMGDHAPDTLNNVIALAPLVHQPLLAAQAWALYARGRSLTDAQWRDIFELYESAAEPALGALFFEAEYARRQLPLLLDHAARLADNAGDDVRAERLYRQRAALLPFSLDSVLRAVVFLIRRDQPSEALVLLKRHATQAPPTAGTYWQLLGQVAWGQQDTASSLLGYENFVRLPQAGAADWVRLVALLRTQHPTQAADLALQAFRRYGAIDQLLTALSIYAEQGDQAAQARVLAGLGAQAQEIAITEPRFMLWRAQFYQRQHQPDLAWVDLRRLLQRQPGDVDVLLSSLWLLIDEHRLTKLPHLMRANAALAAKEPRLWGAFAAGSQALERHRDAVRWYARMVRAKTDDSLTLLNYADALQRSGQTGMADRLRRHAWLQLKAGSTQSDTSLAQGASAELLALARLSLMNQPGDPSQLLIQRLVSQLRALPQAQQDEQALALVLGWAIMKEQFVNARSWMLRSYARQTQIASPLWGQAQVALQLQDTATMARLLARQGDALPIYNRYDTAYALGHAAQAQDIAFNAMSAQDDEPLYDRYRQHVPALANYVQLQSEVRHGAELASHGLQLEARWVVNPRLHVVMQAQSHTPGAETPLMTLVAPPVDQLSSLELRWLGESGRTDLTLFQSREFEQRNGFRLTQGLPWNHRLSLDAGIDYRVDSTVTEPMSVAGYENSVYGDLNYTLGRRESLRIASRFSHYYSQIDDPLGTSLAIDLEAAYRIKTDYPDWRIRGYLTRQLFAKTGADIGSAGFKGATQAAGTSVVDYLLPNSSTSVGACVGLGDNLTGQAIQSGYTRAWRPFGEICLNHNTVSANGINATLGVAGTVTGEDHLRLQLERSDARGAGSTQVNRLALRYRHYF